MAPSSDGIGLSPWPTSTWLMSALPSPKRKDDTARELTLGVIVANEVPAGGVLLTPPLASSFRNPMSWISISNLYFRAAFPDCADNNGATVMQETSAMILKSRKSMVCLEESVKIETNANGVNDYQGSLVKAGSV